MHRIFVSGTASEKTNSKQKDRLVSFAVATLLTCIAGFVDAVGFLTFARVYTANMSGNSVALGIALNQQQWATCLLRFWPILLYVIGLIFGRTLIEIGARHQTRRIASVAFGCEIVLLALVALSGQAAHIPRGSAWQYIGVALLSCAMGIQNSALTKFSSLTLHSGFVTGTLLKFTEQLVAYGTWFFDKLRRGKPLPEAIIQSGKEKSFRLSLFLALTWSAYVIGAVAGTWGKSFIESRALIAPIAGLLLLVALDLFKPLAVQEERQQAQMS